jgi:hypothetical protein
MKKTREEKEALSLNREYLTHLKYSKTPGISKTESEYYLKMAMNTKSKINFELLEPKKKADRPDDYSEEYGIKESRNRYHR